MGWVCLNTDGVVSPDTGVGLVGGIFWADDGSWILRLLIQSDNREAIKRVSATIVISDLCSLVRAIAAIRCRGWATETQWTP
ncbi:hypothetical protein V6N12_054709 [Hibiscus sabdariffa]|uniref:RNase H type-1 domain-containing protein n=1 Tax=Hibiscus sabdariffa TaxID=183260 RepID=A0ABR2D416_9ROSI